MTEPITSTVISKWIVFTLWAALGGITHALVEKRKGGIKDLLDGFILALISGFAGLMWGLLALKFYPNDMVIVSFASGLGGFMSLEGLAIMSTYIKNKFFTK
jgi:hypothetical protein